ncbi:unnamed protein product, partial [Phaeothamnion confervicola]
AAPGAAGAAAAADRARVHRARGALPVARPEHQDAGAPLQDPAPPPFVPGEPRPAGRA